MKIKKLVSDFNWRNSQKLLSTLCNPEKFIFSLCMYKMVNITKRSNSR